MNAKTTQLAKPSLFVGMDLHKIILQIAVVNNRGMVLCNEMVDDNPRAMRKALSAMPPGSKYVIVIVRVVCDLPAHNLQAAPRCHALKPVPLSCVDAAACRIGSLLAGIVYGTPGPGA